MRQAMWGSFYNGNVSFNFVKIVLSSSLCCRRWSSFRRNRNALTNLAFMMNFSSTSLNLNVSSG